MKALLCVDEAEDVLQDLSKWSAVSAYPGGKKVDLCRVENMDHAE